MLKKLHTFAPAYYGAILKQVYTEKVSGEILLAAFEEIGKEISTFDPRHSSLFSWGFRIVRRHISRKKYEMVLQETFGCSNPEAYRRHRASLYST